MDTLGEEDRTMTTALIGRINRWLATFAVVLIFVMMLTITADVCMRYFFNSPIIGTVELNRTLLVIVVFFSLGYAQKRKRHINVELFSHLLPSKTRLFTELVQLLLACGVIFLVSYESIIIAYNSTIESEVEAGIMNFPLWPGRIAMAVGLSMLGLQYLMDAAEVFLNLLRAGKQR